MKEKKIITPAVICHKILMMLLVLNVTVTHVGHPAIYGQTTCKLFKIKIHQKSSPTPKEHINKMCTKPVAFRHPYSPTPKVSVRAICWSNFNVVHTTLGVCIINSFLIIYSHSYSRLFHCLSQVNFRAYAPVRM